MNTLRVRTGFLGLLAGICLLFYACSQSDPACDRVVNLVKAWDCPRDTLLRFHTRMDDTTDVLHPLREGEYTPRGEGRGDVWVFRTGEDLTVFIETADRGHAGRKGKVWADNGQVPVWRADEWGETWAVGRSIGSGWWLISSYLMD